MWTIAGGILLALCVLIAIPILLGLARYIFSIAFGSAVLIGGGYLVYKEPALAGFIALGTAAYVVILIFEQTYKNSRNFGLFIKELKLLLTPAFSLRAKAEKEVEWDKHHKAVSTKVATTRQRKIDHELHEIRAIVDKIWRKYSEHGLLTYEVVADSISVTAPSGSRLFTVYVKLDYPSITVPKYEFHTEVVRHKLQSRSGLEKPIKRQIRAAVFEMERRKVRDDDPMQTKISHT